MNPVGIESTQALPPQQAKAQKATPSSDPATTPLRVDHNKVTLSDEGKALLAALQAIEKESKHDAQAEKTVGDKVESFAHGALGMEHPDKMKEEEDGSYSAGQFFSAAATIGGIILAIA
ncbi:hypothetical protein ACFSJQ_02640 [Vibrio olivae]|uniref:Uncharacterized protein n=1 Tax=Vibrio olivae TaxID=1243002 RepID=A0ABV5HKQ4_9VIBR